MGKAAMSGAERTRRWREAKEHREWREKWKREEAENNRQVDCTCEQCGKSYQISGKDARTWRGRFCSEYCRYCSKLKNPPKQSREVWEAEQAIKRAKKFAETCKRFDRLFNTRPSRNNYSLGDPELDADQKALLVALRQYFDDIDGDDNRRLNAVHNVIRELKEIGNEYQVNISSR